MDYPYVDEICTLISMITDLKQTPTSCPISKVENKSIILPTWCETILQEWFLKGTAYKAGLHPPALSERLGDDVTQEIQSSF